MEKPRITLAQFRAMQQQQRKGTLAELIGRYIDEMNSTATQRRSKPLGIDTMYRLKKIARMPIGSVVAVDLRKNHFIEHCRARIDEGVVPATVMHDVVVIAGVLKYAPGAWADCEDVSDAPIAAAKTFLVKHNLIGKSIPRDRRPANDENAALEDYFEQQNQHARTKVDMVVLARWQRLSGRRISESCRAEWPHWDREAQTLTVYRMKDPRNPNKTKVVALTAEANQFLIDRWETRDPAEPRIFPWNSKTASARYTMAKKALGIKNLRLHDSRRELSSRLVEDGYTSAEAIGFTGHDSTQVFERVYMRLDPRVLKLGPAAKRKASNEPQFSIAGSRAANDDRATNAGSAA